ncbi:MAG: hypothetical protein U0804_27730 [Gemmataceae bacterium]
MFPAYRRTILDKLKTTGRMPDIEERIVFEAALTPQDIHDRYHVLNGSHCGLASHGVWNGGSSRRTGRRTCVGCTWPAGRRSGAGMPMVLMSGWIAADALDQDRARRRAPPRSEPVGV